MGFISRLFGKSSTQSVKEHVRGLNFDFAGWRELERSPNRVVFQNNEDVTLSVDWLKGFASGFPNFSNVRAVRKFVSAQLPKYGLVSMEVAKVESTEVVTGIYKRTEGTGYLYSGILLIPCGADAYVVYVTSGERGTTGVREAVVTAKLLSEGKLDINEYEKEWFHDPYDPGYQGVILHSFSDADMYDADFPDHPLTKVRNELKNLISAIKIAA
jgi:hypothetical protein